MASIRSSNPSPGNRRMSGHGQTRLASALIPTGPRRLSHRHTRESASANRASAITRYITTCGGSFPSESNA